MPIESRKGSLELERQYGGKKIGRRSADDLASREVKTIENRLI
jgi:hypothetical protein